jgi:hypothetical protein
MTTDLAVDTRSNNVQRRQCLLMVTLFSLSTAAYSGAVIDTKVYSDPATCEHLRKQLINDRVDDMSRDDLCRYDFDVLHPSSSLPWRPASGDPVDLTVKIFDANTIPILNNPGRERVRKAVMDYAIYQKAHKALRVDVAPFTLMDTSIYPFKKINGYVLRSRGTYCGNENDPSVERRGKDFLAFYTDKDFIKKIPLPTSGGDTLISLDPIVFEKHYYILTKDLGGLWGTLITSDIRPVYSIGIAEPTSYKVEGSSLQMSALEVCTVDFTRN